jgi:uncharacterized membrane protein (DUF373 family)
MDAVDWLRRLVLAMMSIAVSLVCSRLFTPFEKIQNLDFKAISKVPLNVLIWQGIFEGLQLKDEKSWFFQHPTQVPSALAWKSYIISKTQVKPSSTYPLAASIPIYYVESPAGIPVSHLTEKDGWNQNLLLDDIMSGNRTSLLVIIDLHLIVLVLLIIEYRVRSMKVDCCATHIYGLSYLEES